MKKYECNIIQDLLPNYIEKLTSENTNEYITKHLTGCEQCLNMHNKLNNMSNNNDDVENKKFVKYSKKFKFRFNMLKCIVIFILLIFIGSIIRNVIIIESLSSKASKYNNETNYHSLYQQYDDTSFTIIESYKYNNKYYRILKSIDKNSGENISIIEEKYDGKKANLYITDNEGNKKNTSTEDINNIMPVEPRSYYLEFNSIIARIKSYIFCNIKAVTYTGIECYRFTNLSHSQFGVNDYIYMSKETGLPVRISSENIEGGYRKTQEVSFEFDTITEEKINELIK